MEILNKIKGWASAITEVGISIIALGIVLEILFNGQGIPFWPNISIVDYITGMINSAYFISWILLNKLKFSIKYKLKSDNAKNQLYKQKYIQ